MSCSMDWKPGLCWASYNLIRKSYSPCCYLKQPLNKGCSSVNDAPGTTPAIPRSRNCRSMTISSNLQLSLTAVAVVSSFMFLFGGEVRRSFLNSSYWFTIVHSKYLPLEQSTGANRLSSAPLLWSFWYSLNVPREFLWVVLDTAPTFFIKSKC